MAEYRCKIAHKQIVKTGFIRRKVGAKADFENNPGHFWELVKNGDAPKEAPKPEKTKKPKKAKEEV